MDFGLHNKKVLITGGTRGIGRAIAQSLAREKAQVGVIGRSRTDLKSVTSIHIDLTKANGVTKAIREFRRHIGNPDIIINNIGDTLGISDPYCSLQDWRRVFRINFEIAVELNELCIPHMKKQGWGRIVHTASNASLENSGPVTYCVTKAALDAYCSRLGGRLAVDGIRVSAILPGAIIANGNYWDRTSFTRPDHAANYIQERLPLGRFGRPEDISDIITYLSSDKASCFFGDDLGIDGGQSKHFFGQV